MEIMADSAEAQNKVIRGTYIIHAGKYTVKMRVLYSHSCIVTLTRIRIHTCV